MSHAPDRFQDATAEERAERLRADQHRVRLIARSAERLRHDLAARPDLWGRDARAPLAVTEREDALRLFDRAMDLQAASTAITRFHMGFLHLDPITERALHASHFAVAHRAYFQRLTAGLDLCDRAQGRDQFETLFDEGSPELGLAPGLWTRFKWNVLHVEHVGRAVAARNHAKVLRAALDEDQARTLLDPLEHDWKALRPMLRHDSGGLLLGNALDILRDVGKALVMPVQTEVAAWMGDARVVREDRALISSAQVEEAIRRSRPGDIMFERRNWYLSNIGLPGFWPHAALWIGSPEELSAAFDDDPELTELYGVRFSAHLRLKHPGAWAEYTLADRHGHPRRILEAVSEGVLFSSAQHSISADYAAALRPRLRQREIAHAIDVAFGYWGRPYDFDFDFYSDQSVVCSELVYKAYEPRPNHPGIAFRLVEVLGRMTLAPNEMIAQWAAQRDDARAMDFAWFLDGREHERDAVWREASALEASYRRPKWDIAQR